MKKIGAVVFFDDWDDYSENRTKIDEVEWSYSKKSVQHIIEQLIGHLEPEKSSNPFLCGRNGLRREIVYRAKKMGLTIRLYDKEVPASDQ